jgi:hypothetical protein
VTPAWFPDEQLWTRHENVRHCLTPGVRIQRDAPLHTGCSAGDLAKACNASRLMDSDQASSGVESLRNRAQSAATIAAAIAAVTASALGLAGDRGVSVQRIRLGAVVAWTLTAFGYLAALVPWGRADGAGDAPAVSRRMRLAAIPLSRKAPLVRNRRSRLQDGRSVSRSRSVDHPP